MTEITMPTAEQMIASRVGARLAEPPSEPTAVPAAAQSSGRILAERAAEDATELDSFVEAIAEHFACAGLVSDTVRLRLRGPWQELRALATKMNAEADRAAADPTGPRRGAGGRFASAR